MSHFSTYVITETGDLDEIERLLAPYDEQNEFFRKGSRWDWWVVGGRFTGALDGYDPETDPSNIETCSLCGGSGRNPKAEEFEAKHPGWIESTGGCNGCHGTGQSLKWATQWAPWGGDTRPVSFVLERFRQPIPEAAKVLASTNNFLEREKLWETFSEQEKAEVKNLTSVPFAIVTPDGEWHEQARMGWWGMTIPDEEENEEKPADLWRATVIALLEQHPNSYVTVVDCHV